MILNNSRIEENILKKRTALTTAKSSVALLLFTLPLSSNLAYSAPSTTGEGNIVTGEHGVATGYNNAVTANYGLAQGNNSVATGGNISREEFKAILEKEKQTFADKNKAENELSDINKKIEASNKTAEDLNKRINEITDLIKQSNDKKNQVVTSLNNDLANKQKELAKLDKEREEAKEYASHYPSIYSEDESVSIKFLKQLKELDWNKLSDNSAGTTGVQKLAKDLKERVEADYPNVSEIKKFGIDKYEVIVNGYDNARGSFEYNEEKIKDTIRSRNKQYLFYTGAGRDLSSYASDHDGITDLLKNVTSVDPVKITSIDNIPSRITDDFFSSQKQERYVQFSTLLKMISENNVISDLSKAYKLDKINSQNYYKPNYVANTVFYLPPIKASDDQINHSDFLLTSHKYHSGDFDYLGYDENNKKVEFRFEDKDKAKHYLYYGQTQRFFDEFFDGVKTNTPQDVKRLREWVNRFYNDFDNLIDREAPEEKWLFDKQDFLNQLKDVESFAKKISDYIAVYDEANKSPTPENRAKRNSLYEEISKLKNDSKNYYENIEFKFKESTKKLWNKYADETAKELTDWAKKLKLYDPYNEVVKGITEESEKAQNALNEATIKFEDKEREINDLKSQIDKLQLDSNNSDELKRRQEELAEKQAEKEELEKERAKKEKALKELEERLTRHFSNIGENSIAAGKESFASGTNSIAIGTKNEVTGNNSVAIGAGNKVASHNVMVLGNNVTVDAGFDGAVVLGNESAPSKPMPVESITIQGTTYRFAGTNPTSTVSVGAEGKERQITHVAAGRITSTSTDAINGSQLYSVVEAINQKVTQHNKMLKAGIAGSAAIAGLPQVRGNGKSMVSAGAGNFKGQNAIAVGYSRSSDNGKVLFRLSGSTNTQGDVVSSVGVGYEW